MHLARELKARDAGTAPTSSCSRRRRPGAGASGHRLRRRPQQLLPAGDERADAGLHRGLGLRPAAYHYNKVGYIALGPQVQESDLAAVHERHERIGYRSDLILGEAEVDAHMKALFPDWRAQGVTVCLHEHQGGFAFNQESVNGLLAKCEAEGVVVITGVEVTGFRSGATTASTPSRPTPAGSRSASRS